MSDLIGQRLGHYEIVSLLGKGGMATVYRARQLNIKRDVAVKVIKPDLAETADFAKRFEREAETIAVLSHPHILKLFDYGQNGDTLYLVMELLTGGSLADLIRRTPLSLRDADRMLEQIASALDYAHQQGIIHRDLKPQNVLLDASQNAFLTDFGIAKLMNSTMALTQSGTAMGTPAYMPPEQWRGEPVDARSDIYSLGVMVYEMLSGQLPFSGDTPFSVMNQHVNDPIPSIRTRCPEIPESIDSVLSKALAKDRETRYQSAGQVSAAFKAALSGQMEPAASTIPPQTAARSPVPKRGPSSADLRTVAEPLSRPAASRRFPWSILVIAAGALIVIGVILVGTSRPAALLSGVSSVTATTPTTVIVASATQPIAGASPSPTLAASAAVPATLPPTLPLTVPPTLAPTLPPTPAILVATPDSGIENTPGPATAEPVIPSASIITGVKVTADPVSFTGPCPKRINFYGVITVNAPGTVSYRWERSDRAKSQTRTVTFVAAGSKTITVFWALARSANGWEALHILDPNDITSDNAAFTLSCEIQKLTPSAASTGATPQA